MGTGKLRLETKQNIFWAMVRKVVKITVNHHNSGDHFSKTATTATTEATPTRSYIIPQGINTKTRGMYG